MPSAPLSPAPPSRSARAAPFAVALALLAGACGAPDASPAIGFTYNWSDTALEYFVQSELDRTRPAGGDSIELRASRTGGWQAFGGTPLAAEVRRATILAEREAVIGVVGPGGSREALQVLPVYAAAGVPQLIPTATSALLSPPSATAFLLAANDSVQGEFIGAFADTGLRAKRVAILYVPDEYGIGLAAGIEASLRAREVPLLVREPIRLVQYCRDAAGRAYYDDVVDQLALRGQPDVVTIAARTVEVGCLARALRQRWPATAVVAGDGAYHGPGFWDAAGDFGDAVHLVAFWHVDLPHEASQNFLRQWRARNATTPRHGEAVFYDATMLLATAIREVGADRGRVAAYLRSLGSTRPAYPGVTGAISFAPDARRPLLMTRTRALHQDTELLGLP